MQREFNLTNNDSAGVSNHVNSSRLLRPEVLSRKISDNNTNNNSNSNQSQYQYAHQRFAPNTKTFRTVDQSNSSLLYDSYAQVSSNRQNVLSGYDTDGATATHRSLLKPSYRTKNGYEYLVSPRLVAKRSMMPSSSQSSTTFSRHNLEQQNYFTAKPTLNVMENYDDTDHELNHTNDRNPLHSCVDRHAAQSFSPAANRGDAQNNQPLMISRRQEALAATITGRPLKLIFMRHSERVNQVLGPDWFLEAFRTHTYKAYDHNLPLALPQRRFYQAYEFDTPLTVRGLKNARQTGSAMLSNNLVIDVCLSSIALRCIQTCERILSGMNRREHIPIRVEPGLFECPHLNHKIIDSFMTKKELIENGYNIKVEYKPLVPKLYAPESLDEYFHRCTTVMRGIIDRYGNHGGTILIVTHAPGLLALTNAIKGIRTNQENFYRVVATYPPLATYIAEYDGTHWKYSEEPFSISVPGQ